MTNKQRTEDLLPNQSVSPQTSTQERLQDENKKLREAQEELQDGNQQLEEANQQLQHEEEVQPKNQQLVDENKKLREDLEKLQNDKQQLVDAKQQLQNEKEKLWKAQKELQDSNQQLEEKNQQLQHEKKEDQTKNQQLVDENKKLREDLEKLQNDKQQLVDAKQQLQNEKEKLWKAQKELPDRNQLFEKENQQLQHEKQKDQTKNQLLVNENNSLRKDKDSLLKENDSLQKAIEIQAKTPKFLSVLSPKWGQNSRESNRFQRENESLKEKNAELQKRIDELIGTLVSFNRDRVTTYASNARSQNHLLVHDFRLLKEQDFHFVSILVFHNGCDKQKFSETNRNQEIAKIKSVVSEKIFIKGMNFLTEENAPTTIRDSVYADLGIIKDFTTSKEILDAIDELSRKGFDLLKKIADADPPGQLWIEKEGTPFNPDRHQPILGCEEGGKIGFTIYPGYYAGNRVFEKALVFTIAEEGAKPI